MESLKAMTDLTALLRNSFQVLGFTIELKRTANVTLKYIFNTLRSNNKKNMYESNLPINCLEVR
jgi:hypothetical protein